MQKRVLTIQDISLVGRCSLTVALPLLSAIGHETVVLPTAILSSQPSGFGEFTHRDLSEDIVPIKNHWASFNLKFDAIYSGFLSSPEQIEMISQIFDEFKTSDSLIIVDPVMGDNGKLYSIVSEKMLEGMKKLCSKADVIIPNLTEASFMLGEKYLESDYDENYVLGIAKKLAKLGAKKIILTGISFERNKIGSFFYDSKTFEHEYIFSEKIDGSFHGTGDIFASVFTGTLLNELNFKKSIVLASDFVKKSIEKTIELGLEKRQGVAFEPVIAELLKKNRKK
ncbi:MAG: pyridoxamine kinase [Clostridia bacterium]